MNICDLPRDLKQLAELRAEQDQSKTYLYEKLL